MEKPSPLNEEYVKYLYEQCEEAVQQGKSVSGLFDEFLSREEKDEAKKIYMKLVMEGTIIL